MSHIADLAAVSYSGLKGPIRAVGWLESPHEFARGPVDAEFARRLMSLIERGTVRFSIFCRRHHFEQLLHCECSFEH